MSGEKSKARTVFIWFIIPWIIFAIAVAVIYMKAHSNLSDEIGQFIELTPVETKELVILDKKRALSELVSDERNMPEYIEGDSDIGVLLIHGFTASPYEMHELGEFLNKEYKYSIYNARVAGHGSNPDNLNLLSYKDWYESLKLGYYILKKNNKKLFIAGQSMGALLAMSIGFNNDCDGLVLLSPALSISDPKFKAVPIAKYFVNSVKKRNFEEKLSRFYYNVRPMHGLDQLSKLIKYVRSSVVEHKSPMIVLQSKYDDVVDAEQVISYFDFLKNTANSSLVIFENNRKIQHVLTNELNPEREDTFKIVGAWLEGIVNV